jgi:uncharacterized membrane protein
MDKSSNGLLMMGIVILLIIMNLIKPEKTAWDYAMIVLGFILIGRQLYIFYQSKNS